MSKYFTVKPNRREHSLDNVKECILIMLNKGIQQKHIYAYIAEFHGVKSGFSHMKAYRTSRFDAHSTLDDPERYKDEILAMHDEGMMPTPIARALYKKYGESARFKDYQIRHIVRLYRPNSGERIRGKVKLNPVLSKLWTVEGMAA